MSENEMLEEIKSLSPSEEAILTMLIRYQNLKAELEKEKETSHYIQSQLDIANAKLIEEKEKNKEILSDNIENFQKYFLEEFNKKFISIDKLKEIVDECIPKKENIITRELEYTPNANANSYLTQEILALLKEE